MQPTAHLEQTLGVWRMSQGRDWNRQTLEVRAPTGQRSMMLPLNTLVSGSSNWVAMYDSTPRWAVVSSCSQAISS